MKKLLVLALVALSGVTAAQAGCDNRRGVDHPCSYENRRGVAEMRAIERERDYMRHTGGRHEGNNLNWIVPAIIGGAVIYGATRPSEPVYAPPPQPVYVQPAYTPPVQQVYIQPAPAPAQRCTAWTEVQNYDGTITRSRTCSQ